MSLPLSVALVPVAAGAVYNQVVGAVIHGPLLGKIWLASLKQDKSGDAWMGKDYCINLLTCAWKEFLLNLGRAWCTTMLLNTAKVHTTVQAAQLGALLFVGIYAPLTASEFLWEKRPSTLQQIKLLNGFSSTVIMACLVNWVNTH